MSRVTIKDRLFYLEKPFRFVGANMYELAYVDHDVAREMLKEAASHGFKVVRFWAFDKADRKNLEAICNLAADFNIRLIAVLSDPSGYLQSYTVTNEWFEGGYKKKFLPYALDVVSSFKDRYEIMLWEIINEPLTDSFTGIYEFTKECSEKIKQAASDNLVSIGTIGGVGDKFGNNFSRFSISNFEKLNSIETLDAISLHDYSFNATVFERLDIFYRLKGKFKWSGSMSAINDLLNFIPNAIDKFTLKNFNRTYDFPLTLRSLWKYYNKKNFAIAKKLNKPLYIGETGYKKSLNDLRSKVLENELRNYFDNEVAGVLLWSFESQGRSLDGHDYGFNLNDNFSDQIIKFNRELENESLS